jgi:hypothetical protein
MRTCKITRKCACGCGEPVTSYRCRTQKYVNLAHYHKHMIRPVKVCSQCGSHYKLKRRGVMKSHHPLKT